MPLTYDYEKDLITIKKSFIESKKTQNQVISDFNLLYNNINEDLDKLTKGKNDKIYPRYIDDVEIAAHIRSSTHGCPLDENIGTGKGFSGIGI